MVTSHILINQYQYLPRLGILATRVFARVHPHMLFILVTCDPAAQTEKAPVWFTLPVIDTLINQTIKAAEKIVLSYLCCQWCLRQLCDTVWWECIKICPKRYTSNRIVCVLQNNEAAAQFAFILSGAEALITLNWSHILLQIFDGRCCHLLETTTICTIEFL